MGNMQYDRTSFMPDWDRETQFKITAKYNKDRNYKIDKVGNQENILTVSNPEGLPPPVVIKAEFQGDNGDSCK